MSDRFRAQYTPGGGFTAYTATVTNLSVTSFVFRWCLVGTEIHYTGSFTLLAAPTGAVSVSLPVAASSVHGFGNSAPRGVVQGVRTGVSTQTGNAFLATSTTIQFISHFGGGAWTTGSPVAWAAGDVWGFSVTYERA